MVVGRQGTETSCYRPSKGGKRGTDGARAETDQLAPSARGRGRGSHPRPGPQKEVRPVGRGWDAFPPRPVGVASRSVQRGAAASRPLYGRPVWVASAHRLRTGAPAAYPMASYGEGSASSPNASGGL